MPSVDVAQPLIVQHRLRVNRVSVWPSGWICPHSGTVTMQRMQCHPASRCMPDTVTRLRQRSAAVRPCANICQLHLDHAMRHARFTAVLLQSAHSTSATRLQELPDCHHALSINGAGMPPMTADHLRSWFGRMQRRRRKG